MSTKIVLREAHSFEKFLELGMLTERGERRVDPDERWPWSSGVIVTFSNSSR